MIFAISKIGVSKVFSVKKWQGENNLRLGVNIHCRPVNRKPGGRLLTGNATQVQIIVNERFVVSTVPNSAIRYRPPGSKPGQVKKSGGIMPYKAFRGTF